MSALIRVHLKMLFSFERSVHTSISKRFPKVYEPSQNAKKSAKIKFYRHFLFFKDLLLT